jgi:hypothetical protein
MGMVAYICRSCVSTQKTPGPISSKKRNVQIHRMTHVMLRSITYAAVQVQIFKIALRVLMAYIV